LKLSKKIWNLKKQNYNIKILSDVLLRGTIVLKIFLAVDQTDVTIDIINR
jgi:hypothetical protein